MMMEEGEGVEEEEEEGEGKGKGKEEEKMLMLDLSWAYCLEYLVLSFSSCCAAFGYASHSVLV